MEVLRKFKYFVLNFALFGKGGKRNKGIDGTDGCSPKAWINGMCSIMKEQFSAEGYVSLEMALFYNE